MLTWLKKLGRTGIQARKNGPLKTCIQNLFPETLWGRVLASIVTSEDQSTTIKYNNNINFLLKEETEIQHVF